MCMNNSPLDIIQISVMLQSPLQQASLFAQAGDVGAVVVGEHVVAHDGVGDLRRGHQVHLQQACLQWSLTWS